MEGISSAYQLAKRAGLNMPTAYRAFANDIKHFTPETLEKLCNALRCSPNDIFEFDYQPFEVEPEIQDITVPVMTEPQKIVDFLIGNNLLSEFSNFAILFRNESIQIDGVPVKKQKKIHLRKGDVMTLKISANHYRVTAK